MNRPSTRSGHACAPLASGIEASLHATEFLRIPPFPGAQSQSLRSVDAVSLPEEEVLAEIAELRVGGTYWARQPAIPVDCLLVRSPSALRDCAEFAPGRDIVLWTNDQVSDAGEALLIRGDCDAWHMLSSAWAVVVDEDDEVRAIAAILGVTRYVRESGTGRVRLDEAPPMDILGPVLRSAAYQDPFTGTPMSVGEAVRLCGFWRQLIDSNRDIGGGLGFAFWKRDHVAPLLWGGSDDFQFLPNARDAKPGAPVAIWRTRISSDDAAALNEANTPLIEVEDGFLRSRGLGADCVPPLSITVDRLGAHFDPAQPSELERLLEDGTFDQALVERARELRKLIVEAGLGKYERRSGQVSRRTTDGRRHILVPGQVENDRAVQSGGCGLVSNLDLLARVRAQAPDAFILYKPHPDVLAGHRPGQIAERLCLQHADEVASDIPISSAIDMVDEVHVNTSLAGFEALLREKPVTTHGVPFYAGWGLTRDLGPVPSRRQARRSLDELVAATLLAYPRYLDPVTGLPCPAEVVVERLISDASEAPGLLVRMRRMQGILMRRVRSLGQ